MTDNILLRSYTFVYSVAPYNELRTYTMLDTSYINAYERFRRGFSHLKGFTMYPNAEMPHKSLQGVIKLV